MPPTARRPARHARRRPRRRSPRQAAKAFARLVQVMTTLRSPNGCPWDREQTHRTLRPYLLEEAYEALDALDRDDRDALAGELGDVLLQVVFHAEIAAADRVFDIVDVIDAIVGKLIRRHPHVFTAGGRPLSAAAKRRATARTPEVVLEQWERIKARERSASGERPRVLAGLPRSLPALLGAQKIGERVARVGFDWPNATAVVDKIEEEVAEVRAALGEGRARTEEEMGDLLFSIANLARALDIDAEAALRHANDKFTARFDAVEARMTSEGRAVHDASPDELEAAWAAVKRLGATHASPTAAPTSRARPRAARRSR